MHSCFANLKISKRNNIFDLLTLNGNTYMKIQFQCQGITTSLGLHITELISIIIMLKHDCGKSVATRTNTFPLPYYCLEKCLFEQVHLRSIEPVKEKYSIPILMSIFAKPMAFYIYSYTWR